MEGGSVLGNIAMTVGDLAIEKGIPFLAKKRARGWTLLRV